MLGEPIKAVNEGLSKMIDYLRGNPRAESSVSICIITFDREVKCILPLTPLPQIQLPQIITPESGPTHTGEALRTCLRMIEKDSAHTASDDYKPLLFLLTDGKPSDLQVYEQTLGRLQRQRFGNIVACAAGPKARVEPLKELTENVYRLDHLDRETMEKFFFWVSDICFSTLGDDGW